MYQIELFDLTSPCVVDYAVPVFSRSFRKDVPAEKYLLSERDGDVCTKGSALVANTHGFW